MQALDQDIPLNGNPEIALTWLWILLAIFSLKC